jgi:hypothetical protein
MIRLMKDIADGTLYFAVTGEDIERVTRYLNKAQKDDRQMELFDLSKEFPSVVFPEEPTK